jgi:hypothetical protein
MMEAARTSETLVNFYQTARCYNPEDSNLHTHRRENLKSYLDVILFADDLALLASTEDDLQCSIYNFHMVASEYNMEISIEKLKVMVFCGKEPVPSKICLNNKMIERTNDFTYLGYKLFQIYCKKLQNTQKPWVS